MKYCHFQFEEKAFIKCQQPSVILRQFDHSIRLLNVNFKALLLKLPLVHTVFKTISEEGQQDVFSDWSDDDDAFATIIDDGPRKVNV